MNKDFVLRQLGIDPPDQFAYCVVEVNNDYRDINGTLIRVHYDYDLIKIEFLSAFQGKYKPSIMLRNNGEVTVMIRVADYGDFCFPVTGKDEHCKERLEMYSWYNAFVAGKGNVDELLRICDWVDKACKR